MRTRALRPRKDCWVDTGGGSGDDWREWVVGWVGGWQGGRRKLVVAISMAVAIDVVNGSSHKGEDPFGQTQEAKCCKIKLLIVLEPSSYLLLRCSGTAIKISVVD